MQTVYNLISPEELQIYAEKAGIGASLPADYLEFEKHISSGQKIYQD